MTAALLAIGTELTRGDLANTNGCWLARELTERGYEVTAIDVVDDDRDRIVLALLRLASVHEVVVCTGGLGPTTDDRTTSAAAQAAGVDLERHEPSVAAISERLARYGRSLSASNEKQAYFPKGADVLPNDWGTAPGFRIPLGHTQVFFLPGVPEEMEALFVNRVIPLLGMPKERAPFEIVLRCFGLPEAALNDELDGIAAQFGVTIGYRVRYPEIDVKIHASGPDPKRVESRAEAAALAVERRLGRVVYGRGEDSMAKALGRALLTNRLRLAVAESCTGGLCSSLLTAEKGASSWFEGGIVSYSNDVKARVLGVERDLIGKEGAVSIEVACAMAQGVRVALGAHVALGITGIAGPDGGTEEKPVGTVCFAIEGPFGTRSERKQFVGDRAKIQRMAAFYGLSMLLQALTDSEVPA